VCFVSASAGGRVGIDEGAPAWIDVVTADSSPTYFAIRVCPSAVAPAWWAAAREAAAGAPPAIRSILAGRSRVEVTADEASDALAWARRLDGWNDDELAPLWVYPVDPSAEPDTPDAFT
jgi:hypothetical protein